MARTRILLLTASSGLLMLLCGCGKSAPPSELKGANLDILTETTISGFDPDGEPVIRLMSDGSLQIQFEAIPPFFAEEAGTAAEFDDFRGQLESAAGCSVRQDDREVFIIASPDSDTTQKIVRWLESYPRPSGQ